MALTKQQWYDKIQDWLPRWFWAMEVKQRAHFLAIAELFHEAELQAEAHRDETFLLLAEEAFLDLHGSERSKTRITLESDDVYRSRVRQIGNQSNKPALTALAQSIVIRGTVVIKEDYFEYAFYDSESFYDRGELMLDRIENTFSVILDRQVFDPQSFEDREDFYDSEDFYGATTSLGTVYESLVAALNAEKALGTLYRVVERRS